MTTTTKQGLQAICKTSAILFAVVFGMATLCASRSYANTVLVSDYGQGKVLQYEVTDGNWSTVGDFATGLTNPIGLVQDGNLSIYVSELANSGRIVKYDRFGTQLGVVATEGTDFNGKPGAMTLGPDGNIYLATHDFGGSHDRIYQLNTATEALSIFVANTDNTNYTLNTPRGLAFASDDSLYVAGRGNDSIFKFNGTTGAYVDTLATPNNPEGLYWDGVNQQLIAGTNYLFNNDPSDYLAFELDGTPSTIYNGGGNGSALSFLRLGDTMYATDFQNGNVWRIDDTSNLTAVVDNLVNPGHMLNVIPEPSTLILVGLAVLGMMSLPRRRRGLQA